MTALLLIARAFLLRAVSYLRAHWRVAGPILAVLVAFSAGYLAGRRGAHIPAKQTITTKEDSTKQETSKKTEQKAEEIQKTTDTDLRIVTRKRTITKPSPLGPIITMDELTITGRASVQKQDAKLVDDLRLDKTLRVTDDRVTKTVNIYAVPRFRIGATAGYQFGKDPGPVYGGELDWRPFQPVPLLIGVRAYRVPGGFEALGSLSINF